jgi:succinate--hydroxymethylglutarate CoA-transferase
MEEMGIGYEQLKKINPKLIYATLTGFGPDGPYAHVRLFSLSVFVSVCLSLILLPLPPCVSFHHSSSLLLLPFSLSSLGQKPGYDLMASAMGGMMHITGQKERPSRIGVALTDISTGLFPPHFIFDLLLLCCSALLALLCCVCVFFFYNFCLFFQVYFYMVH